MISTLKISERIPIGDAKKSDKSGVFRNTLIVTGSTVIEKLLFFAVNIVIARYLNLDTYGEYTSALAFASFFSMFTDMGINDAMIRELNYEKEKDITLFNITLLKSLLSVCLFTVFIAATGATAYSDNVKYLILIFGLVRFGDEYLRLYYSYYEGTGRYSVSAACRLLFAVSFIAAVFAVIVIRGGNRDIAWFRFFAVIGFVVILSNAVLKDKARKIDLPFIKQFSRRTAPFATAFISSNIINQGGLVILPLMQGTMYAGVFQNAYFFITTLSFIPSSFGRVFIPYLYRNNKEEHADASRFAFETITKAFVMMSFFIATVLFIYADVIITFVFGAKYAESGVILKIISLAIPFMFNASSIILTAVDKQDILSRSMKYVAVISVMANIVLCRYLGAKGAAYATVLTFFMIFIRSNILLGRNTSIGISNSLFSYMKGGCIFFLCWLAHAVVSPLNPLPSMFVTSVLFAALSLILLVTKDDLRIVREIL